MKDKVALVSGAASGMGAATARLLAREGAKAVVVADLLDKEGEAVVADIKKAQAKLESRGWKPHGDENAQLGKDGKWQLNLYDPDLVRVELMEFKPVQKPCCSEFTAPHPSE